MDVLKIDKLLESRDVFCCMCELGCIFRNIKIIDTKQITYSYLYINNKKSNKLDKLELFVIMNNVISFIKQIDGGNYNLYKTKHRFCQYIDKVIYKQKNILFDVFSLDIKTKLSLIKELNKCDKQIAKFYDYLLCKKIDADINFDIINFTRYLDIDYNIVYNILKLKNLSNYAINFHLSLRRSVELYLILYCIVKKNITNIEPDVTIHELKKDINELIIAIDDVLEKYWLNYLGANKMIIFIQSLIHKIESMTEKTTQIYNIINELTLLKHIYENDINERLIIIVNQFNLQLFMTYLLDYVISII